MNNLVYTIVVLTFLMGCNTVPTKQAVESEENPVWIEMMEQPNVEIQKARESFDNYWEKHTHFKGDRSKQFERWYAINSKRINQFGNVISAAQVSSEFQKLRIKSGANQHGEWFNYGPINVGPRNGTKRDGGRVKDIEFHPTDKNTFFVSTFKGGLFKTSDYGTSWKPLTDNLTEQVFVSEVSAADTNTIFVGTNLGVYESTDGGLNWNPTTVAEETKALLLKTDNQNVLLAGTKTGIYRSATNGESWQKVLSADKVEDLDAHPTNPNIVYASTNGSPGEFYRSDDGGASWKKNSTFGQGCFMGVAVSPAQPDFVYVINLRDHLGDDSFEGFYFSNDAGLTFTKQSGQSPCISGYKNDGAISRGQPNYNLFVCADPVDADVVYAGGVRSWKSTDKGKTWTHFYENITTDGDNLHLDQLNWAFSPNDNRIFAVNDGGVYYLNDDDKFQMITDGLPIAEIYECTQSQTVKGNVAGGTMHCGIKLNFNGEWITPWGGDEATCIIDPTDESYVYHLKYEKVSRSTNGGLNFLRINSSNSERGNYTGTGVLHKSNPNTLFAGLVEIHRSTNARASSVDWDVISSFGGSSKIQKVEQSSANHNLFYVARGSGFYRSDNINDIHPTFSDLTAKLPATVSVNDIATHPLNENLVYILLGSQIYKSADKGESWTNISGDLPQVALLEMEYDNSSAEGIYIGTDIGVFYKDSTITNWVDYSKNIPAVRISGMDIYYGKNRDDSFITISTDGRGFWRSQLYGASTQKANADFNVDKTVALVSEKITFTNTSSENPVGTYKWIFEGATPSLSFDLNPTISYTQTGTYQAKLEVKNSAGVSSKNVTIVVNALSAPIAKFSASQTTVFNGNYVSFTDESDNLPTAWEWTFQGGNPASSQEQNPQINYNTEGLFDVTLKVTNEQGSDSKIWTDFIRVSKNEGSGTLQAHYNFNNNLLDNSGYQRNLSRKENFTVDYSEDRFLQADHAYKASGDNGLYLTNGYKGIGGNNERTVTAWFKTGTNGPQRKTIVSWGQNVQSEMFNVMLHENGRIRVEAGASNLQSITENLNDNTWHHLAVSYHPENGTKLKDAKIYIDGKLDENRVDGTGESYRSADINVNTNISVNGIRIGASNYSNYYFTGSLDDIRIYSESLSAEEIHSIYGSVTSSKKLKENSNILFHSGNSQIAINVINAANAEFTVYDLKGSLVRSGKLNQGLNIVYIKQGMYIASVKSAGSIKTEKIISH
jgi:PKD repeat protein/photosystem II stability/assembly factor-like uncharacterized protein